MREGKGPTVRGRGWHRAAVCLIAAAALSAGLPSSGAPEDLLDQAVKLHQQRRYAEAAGKLQSFLKTAPKHPKAGAAALVLGQCRLLIGRSQDAVGAFRLALKLTKDPAVTGPAGLGAGEGLVRLGRYADAEKMLKPALAAKLGAPQRAAGSYWLGEALFQQGKYREADAAYSSALKGPLPEELATQARYDAALCALRLNRSGEAMAEIRRLLQATPSGPIANEARLRLADALLARGDHAEARQEYERLLAYRPAAALAAQAEDGLIQALMAEKRYAEAVPKLKSALSRLQAGSTRWCKAQLSLGGSYFQMGRYAESAAAYAAAARSKQPGVVAQALYGQALALEQNKKPHAAIPLYNKVARLYGRLPQAQDARRRAAALEEAAAVGPLPKDEAGLLALLKRRPQGPRAPEARYALAALYLDKKQPAKAVPLLEAARKAPEADEKVKQAAALAQMEALLGLKRYAEAAAVAQQVDQEGSPTEVRAAALHTRAWALEQSNKGQEAAPLWERLIQEHPDTLYRGEALLRLADRQFEQGDHEGAAARYRELIDWAAPRSEPGPREWLRAARFRLAGALYNAERYEEASAAYGEYAQAYPKDGLAGEALYWAALSLEKLDRKADAAGALERFLAAHPKHARASQARARLALLKAG